MDQDKTGTGFATFSFLGTVFLLHWLGDLSIVSASIANPTYPVWVLTAYILSGTMYSCVKWYCYVKSALDRYKRCLAEFKDSYHIPQATKIADFTEHQRDMFERSISSIYASGIEVNPKVSDNKSRICMWIMFWPWSAIWTFCVYAINDPIRRLCNAIYNFISGFLQRMSDRVWAGTDLPQKRD